MGKRSEEVGMTGVSSGEGLDEWMNVGDES